MKKLIFYIIITFFLYNLASGQSKNAASADAEFAKNKYSIAIDKYKKAYSKEKNKREKNRIRYQMAECYRFMNNTKRAEIYYKALIKKEYYKDQPELLLNYGNMLKVNEKHEEAIPIFEMYIDLQPDDPRGINGLNSCKMIDDWLNNPTNHQLTMYRDINSKDDDFAPCYANDNYNALIFTSNREGSTGKDEDDWTGKSFTDLFITRQDRKGEWSTPDLLDNAEIINTETNEGVPRMNASFSEMYFTRCGNAKDKKSGCHVYRAERSGSGFNTPQLVELGGDSTSIIGHATISASEKAIIFAADFPDGFGGKDLYIVYKKRGAEEFGMPKNLGPTINTPGDELYPFLRNDSTLYFASNGHPGLGGLDIFYTKLKDEQWGVPENMRYPVNTFADDFGIIFNLEAEEEGFFTSNRKEFEDQRARGGDDIWYFIVPPLEFTLSGIVKDDRTLQFVENAMLTMVGSDGTSVITKSNAVGYYEFDKKQFKPNTTYTLTINKDGYFATTATETTVGIERSKNFERDFTIKPIPREPIVLPEILYDLAKWDLKPQFQDSLQGLIETLDDNPTLVVELASHTDARDTEERNDVLSQKRAQSVVDYLILRGIHPQRLVAKGYGERVPRVLTKNYYLDGTLVFDSATILTEVFIDSLETDELKEYAHQLNRRTEFTVLGTYFVPGQEITDNTKVDIVTKPLDDLDGVYFIPDLNGKPTFDCESKGFKFTATLDKRLFRSQIALKDALMLLTEGVISKTDFEGDPEIVLAESTIKDQSIFTIPEIQIGPRKLKNVMVVVNYDLPGGFFISENKFKELGGYILDEEQYRIIFQ